MANRVCIYMREELQQEALSYINDRSISGFSPLISQALRFYIDHQRMLEEISREEARARIQRMVAVPGA